MQKFLAMALSRQRPVNRIKMSLFRTLTFQSSATFQIFSDFGCLPIFSVTLICRVLIVLLGFFVMMQIKVSNYTLCSDLGKMSCVPADIKWLQQRLSLVYIAPIIHIKHSAATDHYS